MQPRDSERRRTGRRVVGALEVEGSAAEGDAGQMRLRDTAFRFPENLRVHLVVGRDERRFALAVERRRRVAARAEHGIAGLPVPAVEDRSPHEPVVLEMGHLGDLGADSGQAVHAVDSAVATDDLGTLDPARDGAARTGVADVVGRSRHIDAGSSYRSPSSSAGTPCRNVPATCASPSPIGPRGRRTVQPRRLERTRPRTGPGVVRRHRHPPRSRRGAHVDQEEAVRRVVDGRITEVWNRGYGQGVWA